MNKKRVEWNVRLLRSNYVSNKGELIPQVLQARTWSLDDLVDRITDNGCALSAETLRCAASLLMKEMKDCLIEGAAVSTPLGTLTPAVTGMWSTNRLQPEERRQNTATVRYVLSPELKQALSNPLFHEINGTGFRLSIHAVQDHATRTENQCLTSGKVVTLRGCMLLMNGNLPQRGIYLLRADTGKEQCHIRPESFILNTRGKIIFQLPDDLPPGEYFIRIVSQCTTNPKPMKEAAEYTTNTALKLLTE